MHKKPPGWVGWAALGAVTIAAELTGRETLTDAYQHAHPVVRAVSLAGWAILIAHLHGMIPPQYDPLRITARRMHIVSCDCRQHFRRGVFE
jgi:hypothetical protein